MRKLFFAVLVIIVYNVYSQDKDNFSLNNKINKNAFYANNKAILNSKIQTPITQNSYYYDSIRPLSEINIANYADAYPWISPDGLRLYYTSELSNNKLVMAQRASINSYFGLPTQVQFYPPASNYSFWLSNNELDVYTCAGPYVYYAHRNLNTDPFGSPIQITINSTFNITNLMSPSLNQSQNNLYMSVYINSNATGIAEFTRTSANAFSYTRTLPAISSYTNIVGQLSKNELSMFFTAKNISGQFSIMEFKRSTPSDTFNINSLFSIQINDPNLFKSQPSLTDSCNWIVYVSSNINSWGADDLYIGKKINNISTQNLTEDKNVWMVSVFPIPSKKVINIQIENLILDYATVSINDLLGRNVFFKTVDLINNRCIINLDFLNEGVYFINVNAEGNFNKTFKILLEN